MAWLSSNSLTPATLVTHTLFNSLANDIRNWGGNVNGGGYTLANVVLGNLAGAVVTGRVVITDTTLDLVAALIVSKPNYFPAGRFEINSAYSGVANEPTLILQNKNVTASCGSGIQAYNAAGAATGEIRFIHVGTGASPNNGGAIAFVTHDGAGGVGLERMRILPRGSVTINTPDNGDLLSVGGSAVFVSGGQYISLNPTVAANAFPVTIARGAGQSGINMATAVTGTPACYIQFVDGLGKLWQAGMLGSNNWAISNGAAGRLTIAQSDGSFGIGTAAPLAKVDAVVSSVPYDFSLSGGSSFRLGLGAAGTTESLLFGVHSSGYSWIQAILPGSATRPLYINPNGGNVAIGKSVASFSLDVKGNVGINSNNGVVDLRLETARDGVNKVGIGPETNHAMVLHIGSSPNLTLGPFGTCWFNKTSSVALYAMGAMPSYADMTAAIAAGLTSGDLWRRTADGVLFCV